MLYLFRHLLCALAVLIATASAVECNSDDNCPQISTHGLNNQQYTRALQFAIQNCESGNGAACADAAIYLSERTIGQNTHYTNHYIEQICAMTKRKSCSVNAAFERAQDADQAYIMASRGCIANNATACALLASKQLYGQGTDSDVVDGLINFTKACSLNPAFCVMAKEVRYEFEQSGYLGCLSE